MPGKREMTDDELAQTLEYVESLLKAIRSRLPRAVRVRGKERALVAETRFPARNCDVVVDRIADRIRTAKGRR